MADNDKRDENKSSTPTTPVGGSTHATGGSSPISAGSSLGTAGSAPKPPGMDANKKDATSSGSGTDSLRSSSPGSTGIGGSSPGTGIGSTGLGGSSPGTGGGSAGLGSSSPGTGGSTGLGGSSLGTGGSSLGGSSAGSSSTGSGPSSGPSSTAGQSSTLASHTSKPLGGGAMGAGSSAHLQSQGPEHERHQDRSAHQGGQSSSGSGQGYGDRARDAADWAREKYQQASSWASDQYGRGSDRSGGVSRRSRQGMNQAWSGTQTFIQENPVLIGVMGLAAGLLLGALLPRTRKENEYFGEWADEVREQGMRYAREATRMGKDYANQAFTDEDPRFAQHESEFRRPSQNDDLRGGASANPSSSVNPPSGRH